MSRMNKNKKSLYLNQTFCSDDPLFEKIQKAVELEGVERMQVSPHEARLLQFLVQLSKAQKVVEIGTLYAYSTFHIARALPKNGEIWTLDTASERHQKSQKILKESPDYKKIHWVCGQALSSLKTLSVKAPFDMVFIDADKGVYLDYLYWAEENLKQGGLLVADNSFLFGEVYGELSRSFPEKTVEDMKQFNKRLSSSKNWTGALIPTDEGLTVGIRK